jgi:hypothetical protein
MAQSGFQTQLVYGSLTPGAVPSPSSLTTNLSGVELAINAADGKLFYKDLNGNIRTLADINVQGAQGIASITGGTINNTTIGATTPSSGTFTQVVTGTLSIPSLVGVVRSNGNAGFSVATPMVDYVPGSAVGTALGVASLDAAGKVPLSQLPESSTGGVTYLGTWNASTNTPAINSGVGTKGYFYKVSVSGTTLIDGVSTWNVGDQIIFSGTVWERVAETSAPVQSVNGKIGAVVLTLADFGAAQAGANFNITSLNGLTSALSVSQGGTGVTSITGLVKGNGNAPFSQAAPGTDYAIPPTGNSTQLLANNGSGGFSNVTVGAGLSFSSGILTAVSSASGSVTSVNASGGTTGLAFSGGPITTSGTLTLSGTLNVANGGTGRATLSGMLKGNGTAGIVTAVPGLDYAVPTNGTSAQLLANNGSGGFTNVTLGANLLFAGGVLSATGSGSGAGTVTSIDVSGGTTGLTVSGGPVTTNGVLTLGGRLNVANGGTGVNTITGLIRGNGTSAFSAAVAGVDYSPANTASNTQLLGGNGSGGFQNITVGTGLSLVGGVLTSTGSSSGSVTSVQVAGGTTGLTFTGGPITSTGTITAGGVLTVANGGTGATSLSGLVKGNGTSNFTSATPGVDYASAPTGNSTQLLANNGSGGFTNVTVGTGLSYSGGVLTSNVTATIPDNSLTDVKINTSAAIRATKLQYTSTGVSAIARTVASRLGDFFMVKDFGAVGDGSTNDSIAVAAAIAAASAANKVLVFSDGDYSIPSISTISGRVILVGLGNVTLMGTLQYTQTTFPDAADTLTPLSKTAPYFSASGINFQSTTTDYALRLRTNEQSRILSTFNLDGCKFYGSKGLLAQHMIGFGIKNCEFNNVVAGAQLEGCVDGAIVSTRFENQAEIGLRLTNTSDHGTGGSDKLGGRNIRITDCEALYCTVGFHFDKATSVSVSSSLLDYCGTPLYITGSSLVKIANTTAGASSAPTSRFSALAGYVAPPVQGCALYGRPGGFSGGDLSVGVSATSCEFSSYNAGTTQAIVSVDGFFNSTYPASASKISFYDCKIMVNVSHSMATLMYLSRASQLRVVGNTFVSVNRSSTLIDCWRAENCTSYTGVMNDFTQATQSGVQVGSSYERRINMTFVQTAEPTNPLPGDTWVQP